MNRCPDCGLTRYWLLGDGRLKCAQCGRRFYSLRAQAVWNSFRIPEKTKERLLDYFALGVSSYRLRSHGLASSPTRERFFRVVRAAMAFEEDLRDPFEGSGGASSGECGADGRGAGGGIVAFGILQREGQVRVFPVGRRGGREVAALIRAHAEPGSLYYTEDRAAYASLAVRGDHVVVRKTKGGPKVKERVDGIEGFWSYARHWLQTYRGIPRRLFHLYLGEVSYRFNHRHEALLPLLRKHVRHLTTTQINAVLA